MILGYSLDNNVNLSIHGVEYLLGYPRSRRSPLHAASEPGKKRKLPGPVETKLRITVRFLLREVK